MELVSIVITTYGRAEFLQRAIESVLKQTYKNLEILIVDDNDEKSEQRVKTEKIIEKFVNKGINLKYIKNKINMGACYSRNIGIDNAKGKYINFLDDDDELYPLKIEKSINKIKLNEKIGIICTGMDFYKVEKNKVKKINRKFEEKKLYDLKDFLKGTNISTTSTLLFLKKALLDIGKFEEIPSSQEALVILKILNKGYFAMGINESLVQYRWHGKTGECISSNKEKFLKGREQYLEELLKVINNLKLERKEKEEMLFIRNWKRFDCFINNDLKNNILLFKEMIKYKIFCQENVIAIIKIILKVLKIK